MAATNPAILMANAVCIDRCVPDGYKMSVLVSLFAQIVGVSSDPQSLMSNASCIDRCIPDGMKMAVLIGILSQIPASNPSPALVLTTDGAGDFSWVWTGDNPASWLIQSSFDGETTWLTFNSFTGDLRSYISDQILSRPVRLTASPNFSIPAPPISNTVEG